MNTGKFPREANDSFITLLDIYVDIMSDAGRIVTNCENCGQLMITNRANASLTCGRSTCKKERLYKANDAYKKRAMKDPIKEAYLNFDNKCRSYRKKLSGYPELLEKYNKAFDEHREKIRAVKSSLTANSDIFYVTNFIISKMLVHLSFKHLLDRSYKQLLSFA